MLSAPPPTAPRLAPRAAHHLVDDHRVDPVRRQHLGNVAQVRRREPDRPPELCPVRDHTRERVPPPEHALRCGEVAGQDRRACPRARERPRPIAGERAHAHAEAQLEPQRLEHRAVPRPVRSETEISPYQHELRVQPLGNEIAGEPLRLPGRELLVEPAHDDAVGSREREELHPPQERRQLRRRAAAEHVAGMRVERQRADRDAERLRPHARVGEDRLMPAVNAVEVPDGDDGRTHELGGACVFVREPEGCLHRQGSSTAGREGEGLSEPRPRDAVVDVGGERRRAGRGRVRVERGVEARGAWDPLGAQRGRIEVRIGAEARARERGTVRASACHRARAEQRRSG